MNVFVESKEHHDAKTSGTFLEVLATLMSLSLFHC